MKINNIKKKIKIIILILISFVIMKIYWFFFGPFAGFFTLIPAAIETYKLLKEKYTSLNKILLYVLIMGVYLFILPYSFFKVSQIFDNKFYDLDENNLKMELGDYSIINEEIVNYSSNDNYLSFRNKTKETEITFKDALNNNIVIIMDDDWKGKIDEYNKKNILDTIATTQIKKVYYNDENNQNINSAFANYYTYNLNNDIEVTLEISSNYDDLIKNYIIDQSNCKYEVDLLLSENYELNDYNIELIKNYLLTIFNKIDKCSINDNYNTISKKIDGSNKTIYDIYYDGNSVYLEE